MAPIVSFPPVLHRDAPRPLEVTQIERLAERAAAGDVLAVLRQSNQLAAVAARTNQPDDGRRLVRAAQDLCRDRGVAALAGVEILAAIPGPAADAALVDLLADPDPLVRRHANWRLIRRPYQPRAVPSLLFELESGGLDTLHAHRTLRRWSDEHPTAVVRAVATALGVAETAAARARLIDLLGVVPDRGTDDLLVDLAVDADESEAARIAAIGALAERRNPLIGEALGYLAHGDDLIGAHAALALQAAEPTSMYRTEHRTGGGLRIAQLVLAGGLDGQLSLGGRGETGGVASLLVSLGGALGRRDDVDHVVTIGRGSVSDALTTPLVRDDEPWSFGMIAIGDPARPATSPADTWEHLPTIERGLRRVLRLTGPIDMLHLRMADAGTLAGAGVAAAAGLPICFSLAPDPHNVIQSLHSRGELDAAEFARLESDQHVWFRARLVEQLGRDADRIALFPRARPWEYFDDLGLGDDDAFRVATVAEGIDLAAIRRAELERHQARGIPPVLRELADRLPVERRGLPLLVSVGRLHPVKGMERVAAAWASDPSLRARCNLVIIGGDLDQPSPSERSVISAIDDAVDGAVDDDAARVGLILLGGRPHADIARLLVSAARGHRGAWSPGGVYVDGALKEEFGLAVLEAMAAGLVVVAPSTGGPSTYVEPGQTGELVDPGADLADAITRAFALVEREGRVEQARNMVATRYSVETMAEQLVDLYQPVAA